MKNLLIVFLASILFTACEKAFEPEPRNNPEALFVELWTSFNDNYAGFEERNVDWDQQYDLYRPQVSSSTSDADLYDLFKQMLRSLDDGHVKLMTPVDKKVYSSNLIYDESIDDDLFDLDLIKSNYLNNTYKESGDGGNTYGFIADVAYINLAWVSDNMADLDDMLDELSSASGLVVDMRHNSGGDFTWAFSNLGRLTNSERLVFHSKTKNGKGENDYTQIYDWSISPSGEYYNKSIVLITDRYTISAAERAVMAFKTLPNVTHIGDTTNGAFSTMIGMELQNGWDYTLATQKITFVDGMNYEGTGMPPDIAMKNTNEEMMNGQDRTLEEALSLITQQ